VTDGAHDQADGGHENGEREHAGGLAGVFAAALTPLDDRLAPDAALLVRHCRWLLAHGCDGLAVLGTTGEANSFSVDERLALLSALAEAGIPGDVLLPGTGCCAIVDTVRLTLKALEIGTLGVLMLPPFYYKAVTDEGVFASYAEVIERVGDPRLRVVLYQFPQLSGVRLGVDLIERLLKRYPQTIAGIKDSSGELGGMLDCVRRFRGFAVLSGSDEFLLPLLDGGGAGCITAVCNVASLLASDVVVSWRHGDWAGAARGQERLNAVRRVLSAYPLSAALKEVMARHTGDKRWRNIRPPLERLAPDDAEALAAALARLGFAPPAWGA
jgi:4-hydroxy-tetrahydrodipicolinate synthase